MSFLENYKKQGYIVYMDNFYTSPYLFDNLKVLEATGACGTIRPRKGLPIEIVKAKFKQRGEYKCMTYNDAIVSMRILDKKHVTLLSTVYSCKEMTPGKNTGKQKKQEIIHYYNKYMGGVDSNDQLMHYSAFSRQTVKWWKKSFFSLIELSYGEFSYFIATGYCLATPLKLN